MWLVWCNLSCYHAINETLGIGYVRSHGARGKEWVSSVRCEWSNDPILGTMWVLLLCADPCHEWNVGLEIKKGLSNVRHLTIETHKHTFLLMFTSDAGLFFTLIGPKWSHNLVNTEKEWKKAVENGFLAQFVIHNKL